MLSFWWHFRLLSKIKYFFLKIFWKKILLTLGFRQKDHRRILKSQIFSTFIFWSIFAHNNTDLSRPPHVKKFPLTLSNLLRSFSWVSPWCPCRLLKLTSAVWHSDESPLHICNIVTVTDNVSLTSDNAWAAGLVTTPRLCRWPLRARALSWSSPGHTGTWSVCCSESSWRRADTRTDPCCLSAGSCRAQ